MLLSHITNLGVDVLFECREDLLKPTKLTFNCAIGGGHTLHYDGFDFLDLGTVVIEICLYSLLPPKDCALNVVNHVLQFLVLFREQSLLMGKRDEVLLLRSLDDVVHCHEAFLHLGDHSLFSLEGMLFFLLDLFAYADDLAVKVPFDILLGSLPELAFRLQFLLHILKLLLKVSTITLEFVILHSLVSKFFLF
jgi:hypothetical protein